jgi:putative transcriptional regulator
VDISIQNLSILKTSKAWAPRLSTLEAVFRALDRQPARMLEFDPVTPDMEDGI